MLTKDNATLYSCWCQRGFHGLRCDYKYLTAPGQSKQTQSKESDHGIDETPAYAKELGIALTLNSMPNDNNLKGLSLATVAKQQHKNNAGEVSFVTRTNSLISIISFVLLVFILLR